MKTGKQAICTCRSVAAAVLPDKIAKSDIGGPLQASAAI